MHPSATANYCENFEIQGSFKEHCPGAYASFSCILGRYFFDEPAVCWRFRQRRINDSHHFGWQVMAGFSREAPATGENHCLLDLETASTYRKIFWVGSGRKASYWLEILLLLIEIFGSSISPQHCSLVIQTLQSVPFPLLFCSWNISPMIQQLSINEYMFLLFTFYIFLSGIQEQNVFSVWFRIDTYRKIYTICWKRM